MRRARVDQRRFPARVGADRQHDIGLLQPIDAGVHQVRRAVGGVELGAVLPAFEVGRVQRAHQLLEREHRFDIAEVPRDRCDLRALELLLHRRDLGERFRPAHGDQLAAPAHIRPVEPLYLEPVAGVARLVGDPFLVDLLVEARQHAHHRLAARIDADIAAHRVEHVDGLGLGELPRPRDERIRLRRQRPDGAEVDDIGGKLRGQRFFEVGDDLHILAATDGAELRHARHFIDETHAARAVDAARHRGFHQRPHVLVLDRALVVAVAAEA